MNSILDRTLQLEILSTLRKTYPQQVLSSELSGLLNRPYFIQNAFYLNEHELISLKAAQSIGDRTPNIRSLIITAKGLDFLENDGGLSAILGVVTVRLDAKSLRDMIEAGVLSRSDIPEEQKGALKKALETASETSLKTIVSELVKTGISKAPEIIAMLQQSMGG